MFLFKRRKNLIIVVTLLLLLVFLLLSSLPGSPLATATSPISFITTPIQRQLMNLKQKVGTTITVLKDGKALRQENERLVAENARLRQAQTANEESVKEAEEFRQAFALRDKYADVELIGARVISNGMGMPSDTIRLDVGLKQDIIPTELVTFPVVNEWGRLVGRVFASDATSSKLITMSSDLFSLSCAIGENKIVARLCGDSLLKGTGQAVIDQIPLSAALKVDEIVYTSGNGGVYPPDLVVGRITKIEYATNGAILRAYVDVIEAKQVGSILFVMKGKKS